MTTWSRRRRITLGVGVAGVLWLVLVSWVLFGVRRSLDAGGDELRSVRRNATVASLVDPQSRRDLATARDHFDDAERGLDNPLLLPLRVLPGVSRQLNAADGVAATAQGATSAAEVALADLTELAEQPQRTGAQRLATLEDLAAVADRTQMALGALDPGEPDALIGPLGEAVTEIEGQRADAERAAGRLEALSQALSSVLTGPDPYLVLGANNAEMRNGSGMFLSAAELELHDGNLALGDVRPTAELVRAKGSVPVPAALAANWPWLDTGRDLRNLGLTADFPQSAAIAVEHWEGVPDGGTVAGVISLDVDGVRALLRVVGPVEVDGTTYTADNVRGELLREQYRRYEGDRAARRDQLGEVSRAIFTRIEAGEWDFAELATAVADAVQRRHLLIWSVDPKVEAAWHDVGADGHLTARSLSVSLLSRSASKVDSWIDTAVEVTSQPAKDGRRALTITYDITNEAPADGPAYLVGPNVAGLSAGDQVGLVVINLPAGTTDVGITGARTFLEGGDGPTVVVAGEVTVPRGATARVTVTARLANGVDTLDVVSSARIPRTIWTIDGAELDRPRSVTLD